MVHRLPRHRITSDLYDQDCDCPTAQPLIQGGSNTNTPVLDRIPSRNFFDLVIIGSGPAALALIARILESRPAALYTEDEHRHLHWLTKSRAEGNGTSTKTPRPLKTQRSGRGAEKVFRRNSPEKARAEASEDCACDSRMKILVLDKLGEGWMGMWNRLFEAYEISHLRSPLFFHPGPADLDSLLAFAERKGRSSSGPPALLGCCDEPDAAKKPAASARSSSKRARGPPTSVERGRTPDLVEIAGVVGKEVSKHRHKTAQKKRYARLVKASGPAVNERERKDYFTPSTRLFRDFCTEDVVQRYGLAPLKGKEEHLKHGQRRDKWPAARDVLGAGQEGAADSSPTPDSDRDGDVDPADDPPVTMLRGEVTDLRWGQVHVDGLGCEKAFRLGLGDGTVLGAKAVVSAVGAGGRPAVPQVLLSGRKEVGDRDVERVSGTPVAELVEKEPEQEQEQEQEQDASSTSDEERENDPCEVQERITPSLESCAPHNESTNSEKLGNAPNQPCMPAPAPAPAAVSAPVPTDGPGWCHSSKLAAPGYTFPNTLVKARIAARARTTLVVVGGGLTSAQVCDLALRRGFEKVVLMLRGHLKVKPFDIDLEWMGKYQNLFKMIFWQEEDPIRRLEMLREARQGGSVTRPYAKLLRTHEAQGRLEIRTFTQVEDASWDQDSERWTLRLGSTSGNGGGKVSGQTTPPAAATGTGTSQNEASSSEQVRHGDAPATTSESETCSYAPVDGPQRAELEPLKADFIVSATGSQLSFSSLPFMRDLSVSHPVREVGGLPVLTEDLQWGRELPFFCVGGYSALQIGPAAFNLGGIREAADRVATRLGELSLGFEDGSTSTSTTTSSNASAGTHGQREKDSAAGIQALARSAPMRSFTHFGFDALAVEG